MSPKRPNKQAKRKRKQPERQGERADRQRGRSGQPPGREPASRRESPESSDEAWARDQAAHDAVEDARAALRADAGDVGALFLLAQVAASGPTEALALLEQAVEATERKLRATQGEHVFEQLKGVFWGVHETRPYMHARFSLAVAQQVHGRTEQALGHFEAMLELCPNDNQFVRPHLVSAALEAGRLDVAERVCAQFADDALCWLPWTHALLRFARGGADDSEACDWLERACAANPHVVDYLTGALPLQEPEGFSPGDREEAATYAVSAIRAWAKTPGALRWLHTKRELTGARVSPALLPRSQREGLRRLPQSRDAWRVAWRAMPGWLEEEQAQPWANMVVSESGLILTCEVSTRAPSAAEAWALCKLAMLRPAAGKPTRPRALEIDAELLPALAGPCAAIGVDASPLEDDDPELTECFSALTRSLRGGDESGFPAWTRRPGVSDSHVRGLCAAAESFYRRTPWHRVADREGFVLSPAQGDEAARALFGEARPCAVVMGAAGETYGLALYDSLAAAREVGGWTPGNSSPSATTVTYDPEGPHHDEDLARFRALSCAVPGPEALPLVFRVEREDHQPVAPTPRQVARLETALRLVPVVVEQNAQRATLTVQFEAEGAARVDLERVLLEPDADQPAGDADDLRQPRRLAGAESVLPEHQAAFEEMARRLERFFAARRHLGPSVPCVGAAALLCSLPDSPVGSGYPRSWAAGVAHAWLRNTGALGHAILAAEVAEAFEVSRVTATNKARAVDDALRDLIEHALDAPN
jgi:tetratricopeptide (TPR) repeat protein